MTCKFQTAQTQLRYRRDLYQRKQRELRNQFNLLGAYGLVAFCVAAYAFVCAV